jgi:hypothetical protein
MCSITPEADKSQRGKLPFQIADVMIGPFDL